MGRVGRRRHRAECILRAVDADARAPRLRRRRALMVRACSDSRSVAPARAAVALRLLPTRTQGLLRRDIQKAAAQDALPVEEAGDDLFMRAAPQGRVRT